MSSYNCPYCGRLFGDKNAQWMHAEAKHKGKKFRGQLPSALKPKKAEEPSYADLCIEAQQSSRRWPAGAGEPGMVASMTSLTVAQLDEIERLRAEAETHRIQSPAIGLMMPVHINRLIGVLDASLLMARNTAEAEASRQRMRIDLDTRYASAEPEAARLREQVATLREALSDLADTAEGLNDYGCLSSRDEIKAARALAATEPSVGEP